MVRRLTLVTALGIAALLAQSTSPKGEPAPKAEPAAPTVLEYSGKPLRIPFSCGEDDIQSFGMTCTTDETCAVYFEIAAIEQVNNRLFLSGNLHTASATMFSILLNSEDNGKTWIEAHERLRGVALEAIQFFDFASGWIAGQSLQALPRDPFFLLTTDGGKTWRNRPVFGESRVGSIESFHFDSKNNGALLLTVNKSYELLETQSGGESWTIRQVSRAPLSLKQTRRPNPDWRLRPDSKTKSFHVEKKQGAQWVEVSAFLLDAGECKPKETVLGEPPPDTPSAAAANIVMPDDAVDKIVIPSGKKPARKKR